MDNAPDVQVLAGCISDAAAANLCVVVAATFALMFAAFNAFRLAIEEITGLNDLTSSESSSASTERHSNPKQK
jgi:hypothetical protein